MMPSTVARTLASSWARSFTSLPRLRYLIILCLLASPVFSLPEDSLSNSQMAKSTQFREDAPMSTAVPRTLDPAALAHLQGWVGKTETLADAVTAVPVRALSATLDLAVPEASP